MSYNEHINNHVAVVPGGVAAVFMDLYQHDTGPLHLRSYAL